MRPENVRIFHALVKHYTKHPHIKHDTTALHKQHAPGENLAIFERRTAFTVNAARKKAAQNLERLWETTPELHGSTSKADFARVYPAIEQFGPPNPRTALTTPGGKKYLPYVPRGKGIYYRNGVVTAVLEFMIDHPGERLVTANFARLANVDPGDRKQMQNLHSAIDILARRIMEARPNLAVVRKRGGSHFNGKRRRNRLH